MYSPPGPSKASILIIDDSPSLRSLYSDILSMYGYTTSIATDGQDALIKLRSSDVLPDLIILDLEMPIKDGLTFRKEQLEDILLKKIPVIVSSASISLEIKVKEMDVKNFIQKPASIELLVSQVQKVLESV